MFLDFFIDAFESVSRESPESLRESQHLSLGVPKNTKPTCLRLEHYPTNALSETFEKPSNAFFLCPLDRLSYEPGNAIIQAEAKPL